MRSVEADVFPDKCTIKVGKITFEARRAEIHGAPFHDVGFALLAVADERALDLLARLNASGLREVVKNTLMRLAVSSGVEEALKLLEKYLSNRPSGATVFRGIGWSRNRLNVGDGDRFVEVRTCLPETLLESLPENVYVSPVHVSSFPYIDDEMFKVIMEDPGGFLQFALRVCRVEESRVVQPSRITEACLEYFRDRRRAEEILKKLEEELHLVEVGESLLVEVTMRSLIEVANGYLVRQSPIHNTYFVDGYGNIYLLSRRNEVRTKRAVGFLAVKGRVPPGSPKNRVTSKSELMAIARLVGKKRPDLAVMIAP